MGLTEHQLQIRQKYLTASDVAAVLGLSPWKSPADVLLEKTGKLGPRGETSDAAELGLDLEPMLIDWQARVANLTDVRRNQWRVAQEGPASGIMAATLDAVARNGSKVGIEAKTSGLISGRDYSGEWGEPGTDQVPTAILIQAASQLIVEEDMDRVYIPALIVGRGRVSYVIQRDEKGVVGTMEAIVERVVPWWVDHVIEGKPLPEGGPPPSIETLKRIVRQPGKTVDWTNDAAAQKAISYWRMQDRLSMEAKVKAEEAKAKVIALLGDAEAAHVMIPVETEKFCGLEPRILKFAEQSTGKRIDSAAFKAAHPDLFNQFAKEGRTRVLRLTKGGAL